MSKEKDKSDFDNWAKDLEEQEQPKQCNLDDPEGCESCSG